MLTVARTLSAQFEVTRNNPPCATSCFLPISRHPMPRFLLLACALAATASAAVLPPVQPKSGPGGAQYLHAGIRETVHGRGARQYWLFEPQQPMPDKAPLIIFLPGYSVMTPEGYRAWIEHLVRRGNIVIYPRYQDSLLTPPAAFHGNTLAAVRAALATLNADDRVKPDLRRVAVAGHSAGAIGAIHYTAAARAAKLPEPKTAVLIQPGQGPKEGVPILPLELAGELPKDLRLIIAVGDSDSIVGDISARRVWRATNQLRHRAFVSVQSDSHGSPALRAGHLSPLAAEWTLADALDWFGWWRLLDCACESAFTQRPLQLDASMGAWSDGRAVNPLRIEYPSAR
jgi:hypothetical protein